MPLVGALLPALGLPVADALQELARIARRRLGFGVLLILAGLPGRLLLPFLALLVLLRLVLLLGLRRLQGGQGGGQGLRGPPLVVADGLEVRGLRGDGLRGLVHVVTGARDLIGGLPQACLLSLGLGRLLLRIFWGGIFLDGPFGLLFQGLGDAAGRLGQGGLLRGDGTQAAGDLLRGFGGSQHGRLLGTVAQIDLAAQGLA